MVKRNNQMGIALKTLIDQTASYSSEATDRDMKVMYRDDMRLFSEVQVAITFGNFKKASSYVDAMDTEPREQVVMALVKDLGAKVVAEKFGEQNFRVLSEMRILGKNRVAILDFGRVCIFFSEIWREFRF